MHKTINKESSMKRGWQLKSAIGTKILFVTLTLLQEKIHLTSRYIRTNLMQKTFVYQIYLRPYEINDKLCIKMNNNIFSFF